MRGYIITTGIVFFLITLAHILRVFAEGSVLLREPAFILLTLAAAGLSIWAARLVWHSSDS